MDEIIMKTYRPARARGNKLDNNSNLISGRPLFSGNQTESHGVCVSQPNWRAKANAKPLIVRNQVSDSFCL